MILFSLHLLLLQFFKKGNVMICARSNISSVAQRPESVNNYNCFIHKQEITRA